MSGSLDCTVRVWSTETGQEICAPFTGHNDEVNSVSFLTANTVASASNDATIRVWDLRASQRQLESLPAHSNRVNCVAVSLDAAWIVSGSSDTTVGIWNSTTGDQKNAPLDLGAEVWAVGFSPDGNYVVAGCSDHTVRIFDARAGAGIACTFHGTLGPSDFSVILS